uniref:Uncharacterized protein n=1 Tax=Solanum tuberosum TaxID=4113 RepID=M0ZIV8_SOLTU
MKAITTVFPISYHADTLKVLIFTYLISIKFKKVRKENEACDLQKFRYTSICRTDTFKTSPRELL